MLTEQKKAGDSVTVRVEKLFPCYLLVLAVFVFYSNVYNNGFLYDDEYLIQKNMFLRDWHSFGAIFTSFATDGAHRAGLFYRPLQNLFYLVIYQTGGESLTGFHMLNVSLHAANACLVYTLGRKLNFLPGAVFCAALLWALHPVHVEAVTYMSATADALYTLFCLWGVIVLLPDFTPRKIACASVLMALGLSSKETAIVFPLLVMSCMYLMTAWRLNPRFYVRTWPLWAIAAAYLITRFVLMHVSHTALLNVDVTSRAYGEHIDLRVYTFLATIPSYLQLLIWPTHLHMDRDFPVFLDPWFWKVFAGAGIVLASAAQIVRGRGRRGLPLSWGLIWFAAAQMPQTGILLPVNALFLEHWMYLPSIGLFLGLAQTLATTVDRTGLRRATGALAAVIALTLGICTYQQNKIWRDPFVFYRNILDKGETSVRAHNNLGIAYMDGGDYEHAMEQFQQALREHDYTPETHENIASCLSKMPGGGPQSIPGQIQHLQRALELDPDFLAANESLESIYTYLGDREKAAYYQARITDIRTKYVP